jgi:hypothetical protein
MMRSFWYTYNLDMGARTEGVLSAAIELPRPISRPDRFEFNRRLLSTAETMPGVVAAITASSEPGRGYNGFTFELEGRRRRRAAIIPGATSWSAPATGLLRSAAADGRDFGQPIPPSLPKSLWSTTPLRKSIGLTKSIGKRLLLDANDQGERPLLEIIGVAPTSGQ